MRVIRRPRFVTKKLSFRDTLVMNAGYPGRKLQGGLFDLTVPDNRRAAQPILTARQAGRAQP